MVTMPLEAITQHKYIPAVSANFDISLDTDVAKLELYGSQDYEDIYRYNPIALLHQGLEGWVLPSIDLAKTSASNVSDNIPLETSYGSATVLYIDFEYKEPLLISEQLKREYISLSEALKLEDEIYKNLVERKAAARKVEASYLDAGDELY